PKIPRAACHNWEPSANKKVSRAALGGPTQRGNAAWRNAGDSSLPVFGKAPRCEQAAQSGDTMNEFSNGFSAIPNGFSEVSTEERNGVDGGNVATNMSKAATGVLRLAGGIVSGTLTIATAYIIDQRRQSDPWA